MTTGYDNGRDARTVDRSGGDPVSTTADPARIERADTYALLATLLAAPPGDELLTRLAGLGAAAESVDTPLAGAWRDLGELARATEFQAVAEEYQDLFIGLTQGEVVPYGSWYRTGVLFDRPLMQLRADLTRLGFARASDVSEPEDHAALLCEVMQSLLEPTGGPPNPVSPGAPSTAQFFQRHLQPWLPAFFADLQQAPSANFYVGTGRLGADLMAIETRYWAQSSPTNPAASAGEAQPRSNEESRP